MPPPVISIIAFSFLELRFLYIISVEIYECATISCSGLLKMVLIAIPGSMCQKTLLSVFNNFPIATQYGWQF